MNRRSTDVNTPRAVVFEAKGTYQIRLHNPKGIAEAVGPLVLGSFLKCFMGVERILTLEHLLYLNNQAAKNPGPEADEYAFARNNMIVGMMLAGTMYEMGAALQQLCDSKVAVDPALRASWARLNELRAEWNTNPYAAMFRNNFVFHLGEPADYVDGIMRGDADPSILYETTGGKRSSGRYCAPWDALLKAHRVQDEEIGPFLQRTQKAHAALPELMFMFFSDVLRHRGVPIVFEGPEDEGPEDAAGFRAETQG